MPGINLKHLTLLKQKTKISPKSKHVILLKYLIKYWQVIKTNIIKQKFILIRQKLLHLPISE